MSQKTLTRPEDLVAAGFAGASEIESLAKVAARYSVAVPVDVAGLIERRDDPLGRQFLPDAAELTILPHERADPIGDDAHEAVKGLIHRYPDRALLKLTSLCPVYCRFCFRRERVGAGTEGLLDEAALDAAFAYLAAHEEIWELIVTGGDPLAVSPRRLAGLSARLRKLDHVKILRFHSRVPALAPERVTEEAIAAMRASDKTVYVALHVNHPRELTPKARAAIARLVDSGIAMVSQTVLLRGVNDNVETLSALMRSFVENRVKPYYLHHADLAPGTSHLRLPLEEGRALVRALLGRISGLCQPVYVVDIPGGRGKAPAGPNYWRRDGEAWRVEDWRGTSHAYADPPAPAGQRSGAP
ncbi:lysine-2,3-aminomutase-like protein [Rhodoblastus acidophilus]|uniref:Lysine-2,3-aminomutase-like protein n=1 Tax=Candidatus Rhodoblastus alkanivorans TaxID=2954117 RepID=A0ABS9Z2J5_9HYPH|nr:lysine-2,3-aminomutase-like protein [Candidatus Rhodoblastus alkanivorans]MCI4677536.1 lysine-2,3-aminomutase-like protein [Candidatus Rhodoblastus alkanivorans]MCI4681895.1 lysine-2,3-aminomutase-like protein [Candidatus Rhodoblastus alkanivorans]MDI4642945.1 lysine-2,3-aminomutase-like protein [Rhodoblastus acidophilus]